MLETKMMWREFKALGTEIELVASLTSEQKNILEYAEAEILNFERRFSRFLEGNELAKFNDSKKSVLEVSADMAELLKEIKYYYQKTGGIFDPTVIGNLEAVGYKRSFDQLDFGANSQASDRPDTIKLQDIFRKRKRIDNLKTAGRVVNKPAGLRIDLGGIGKGYIIDRLSRGYFQGVKDYWLSAGGDLIVSGNKEGKTGWDIAVQDPFSPDKDLFFINTAGKRLGIATSGIIRRSGQNGSFKWHHIIDPRSGLPLINDILSVTVISSNAVRADVFAKTILILGQDEGLRFIDKESDSACIIFTKDKKNLFSRRATNFLNNI